MNFWVFRRRAAIVCVLAFNLLVSNSSFASSPLGIYSGGGASVCSATPTAATSSETNNIWASTIDTSGNIYYIDRNNYLVCKINTSGMVTAIGGTGFSSNGADNVQATTSGFKDPFAIGVDGFGNVYVSDISGYKVKKINTSGVVTTILGAPGTAQGINSYSGNNGLAINATTTGVYGIAIDPQGDIFLSETNSHVVRKIDTFGIISVYAGTGVGGYSGDGGQANAAQLYGPAGLAFDSNLNLYISDQAGYIRKINSAGVISTYAGTGTGYSGDGGQATAAKFNTPVQIAFDGNNNLFIADRLNYLFREVLASSGVISTFAGNNSISTDNPSATSTANATFYQPMAPLIDQSGNIYLVSRGTYIYKAAAGLTAPAIVPMFVISKLSTAMYQKSSTISVATTGSGTATFYEDNLPIYNCRNLAVSGSIVSCNWKPGKRGTFNVYAVYTSGNFTIKSASFATNVTPRIGAR
jgi:hypothetical protein